MLFTGPEHPITEIAAGNPHWQLQTKKRMEERNQGRRIPAQLPRIKDPVGFAKYMAFFNSAVGVLQTLVIALGAGLGIWGVINLMEGYGNDNPGAKSQGMKHLISNKLELT